jgi:ATP-dependent RNA helicase RhlE
MGGQLDGLKKDPHVVIGTPGRIIDHLEQKTLSLERVGVLVLDEADRMLDMGFMPQVRKILKHVPVRRQTMLFSATMPKEVVAIAERHMKSPAQVEAAPPGTTAEKVEQALYIVAQPDKPRLLEKLLVDFKGTVLVFTRTRFGAKKVARVVNRLGHEAAEIHSDRSQNQRRDALMGFKEGRYRVLVATDIASRGIDVTGIELVLNYDVPQNPDDYVHRIGRTGRAGREGKAITFATPEQGKEVRAIEKYAGIYLPTTPLPELPPARAEHRGGGFRGGPVRMREERRGIPTAGGVKENLGKALGTLWPGEPGGRRRGGGGGRGHRGDRRNGGGGHRGRRN